VEAFKPKPEPREVLEAHLSRLKKMQELHNQTNFWKDTVELHIDTGDYPFAHVVPLSDLHLAHQGVDMEDLSEYLNFVEREPVYIGLHGDLGDFFNPSKHADGMFGDIVTPEQQMEMLRAFMERFQNKILYCTQSPSHDDWVRQASGVDPYYWITKDLNIPLVKGGGLVNLSVNEQLYRILVFHGVSRYNSSFNRTHALKRARELHKDADIVIGGHKHIGAMEKAVHREDKPYFVQLGTFKTEDGFGTRKGMFPKPQVFFPTLFLDSKKHNVEAIEDRETAEMLIEALGVYATGYHGTKRV